MTPKNYLYEMIRSELTWVVGDEYVQANEADNLGHSIDYYWVPECWHDRGERPTPPDLVA